MRGKFSKDSKWMEAKRIVRNSNWIEIVHYYHTIGGHNVMVYSLKDREKRLILEVVEGNNVVGDRVLLLTNNDEIVAEDYDEVLNSRKQFSYAENIERTVVNYKGKDIVVYTERR
jgi:hypothetical protein